MSSEFMRAINQKQNIFSELRLHLLAHIVYFFSEQENSDKNKFLIIISTPFFYQNCHLKITDHIRYVNLHQ